MLLLWLTSNNSAINTTAFLTTEELYNPKAFFIHAAHGCVQGSPLRNIPHCCLRGSLGRVSVPVWLAILRPARDRRLSRPTHQLPNLTWVHPLAVVSTFHLSILCGISHRFQWLSPSKSQIPKPYSPVRPRQH